MYFEESTENSDNVAEEYEKSDVSIPLMENTIIGKWDCEINNTRSLQDDEQEGEEETIATFVTASGQQLALYSVEDSDEIFAVAVYDESGEPPTNFQFLMKADVERLIGEGAVRTVKKPSQMKKRLLTTHPPLFLRKEGYEKTNQPMHEKITHETLTNSEKCITQEEDAQHSDVNQDVCKQEDKFIERSTVQYILFEDDESDSELTFDEIQATLQNLNNSSKRTFKNTSPGRLSKPQNDYSRTKRDISRESPDTSLNLQSKVNNRTTISPENELEEQQCIMGGVTNYSPTERETMNGSLESTQPQLKIKRSRKQQLTSVNRDDGEIIIQPASMLNEEETRKKRGRKKRKLPRSRVAIDNAKRIKRITRRKKVVEVIELDIEKEEHRTKRNVVEITLDDSKDKYSSDKENEIIMVRDSDPDNDDDDDDDDDDEEEEEESRNVMRCEYCFKNFRQQRTFDTHLRICQKAPGNMHNVSEKKLKNKEIRKEYACKVCQEKFDVVVALARHVRAEHSQKKKHKFAPVLQKAQDKSFKSVEQQKQQVGKESVDKDESVNKEPITFTGSVKRKRKQRGNRSWREAKKLSCSDCGRWFPSSTLLDTHSLQHDTKTFEQQLRQCQVCKKLIKSRLLFLRHLKMHSDAQCNTNSETLRRKLRTRQGTRKIVPLRKRGRPRKL